MSYKIELSAADVLFIGSLLEREPYKDVHGLVARVQAQINQQDSAARAEAMKADALARTKAAKKAKRRAPVTPSATAAFIDMDTPSKPNGTHKEI